MAVLVLLAACSLWDEPVVPGPIPPVESPWADIYEAPTIRVKRAVPEAFSAPLPVSDDVFWEHGGPPHSHVVDGLCLGDPDIRGAFDAWVAQHPAPPERVAVLTGCDSASFCAWARTGVDAGGPDLYWHALAQCRDPVLLDVFARPEAPDEAVAGWFSTTLTPFHPRLLQAADRIFAEGEGIDTLRAARALSRHDRPEVAERLVRLYREGADWAAWELHLQSDPEAEQVFRGACRRAKAAGERIRACRGEVEPDPLDDLASWLRDPSHDARLLRLTRPDFASTIDRALDGCVRQSVGTQGAHCLRAVAATDWAQAARLAEPFDGVGSLASTLRSYPGRDEVVRELRTLGLLGQGDAVPDHAVTAPEMMVAAGRAYPTPIWRSGYPLPHARRVRASLAIAGVFLPIAQVDPSEGVADRPVFYTLRAWHGGVRHHVLARHLGPGIEDVLQPVAFANTLLGEVGSAQRVMRVDDGRPDEEVLVAGEPSALRAAVEKGLLRPVPR